MNEIVIPHCRKKRGPFEIERFFLPTEKCQEPKTIHFGTENFSKIDKKDSHIALYSRKIAKNEQNLANNKMSVL